jgi:hypothetical protein
MGAKENRPEESQKRPWAVGVVRMKRTSELIKFVKVNTTLRGNGKHKNHDPPIFMENRVTDPLHA